MRHIWNAQAVQEGPGRIAAEKLPALAMAVYGKCDALDGLADGIIENPLRCNFDPATDVPKCVGHKDAPECFTSAQIASLKKVYGGVRNSSGKLLFPGQLSGAEIATGWDGTIVGKSRGLELAETYIRYMAFEPPPGPEWSCKGFNFDTDPGLWRAFMARYHDESLRDCTFDVPRKTKYDGL
jgi:feruloyl esterase